MKILAMSREAHAPAAVVRAARLLESFEVKQLVAAEIILSTLSDGQWHRQREVITALDAASIPERTWRRAKSTLGVQSRQGEREWWWRLPEAPGGTVAAWQPGCLTDGGRERE